MSQASREARSSCPESAPPQSDKNSIHIGQPSYGPFEGPEAPRIIDLQSDEDLPDTCDRLIDTIQSVVPGAVCNFDGKSARIDWPTGVKVVHKLYRELPNLLEDNACALWVAGSYTGEQWCGQTKLILVAPSNTAGNTLEIYDGVGAWPAFRDGQYRMAISSPDQSGDEMKLTGDGRVYEDVDDNGRWRFMRFEPLETSRGRQVPIPENSEQGFESDERIAEWLETVGGE
jgi:hypothetical protein